ncbi:MAG: SRPBCC family protein [Pseudomonadota bacterium]
MSIRHNDIVPNHGDVWNNSPVQKILYAIGGLILLLIAIGLMLPSTAVVVASIDTSARPATLYALINDFRQFNRWSPAIKSDPNARVIYSGPIRGVGASMTWDGLVIGTGTQTITASEPFRLIETVINEGESSEARTRFEIIDGGSITNVLWTFEADYGYNIVGRYASLLLLRVIQRDYQDGLLELREMAEALPRTDFASLDVEHLFVEATDIAFLPTVSAPDPTAISEALGQAYFRVTSFMNEHQLAFDGAPLSIMRSFDGSVLQFDSAIPVRGITDATPLSSNSVSIGKSYAGPVIRVQHLGSYRRLADTHLKIASYLAAHGIERNGDSWESYVSDPTQVDEADLVTLVYYPIVAE